MALVSVRQGVSEGNWWYLFQNFWPAKHWIAVSHKHMISMGFGVHLLFFMELQARTELCSGFDEDTKVFETCSPGKLDDEECFSNDSDAFVTNHLFAIGPQCNTPHLAATFSSDGMESRGTPIDSGFHEDSVCFEF